MLEGFEPIIMKTCIPVNQNESFAREEDGSINLWKLYNLFTGANKSSYIDSSLDRLVGLLDLSREISSSFEGSRSLWYLS